MGKRVTHDEFVNKIQSKYPGKYSFLSKYAGCEGKIHIRYNECGHDDWVKPPHLKRGCRCGICVPHKYTTEYTKQFIEDHFHGYSLVGEYIDCDTMISVKHDCGQVFEISPESIFIRNVCNCPRCVKNGNHHIAVGVNDIHSTHPWLFDLLVDKDIGYHYQSGSRKKVNFYCPQCGDKINQMIVSVYKYGVLCPKCKKTIYYPERLFGIVLEQLGINNVFQFSPSWAGRSRYDFQLFIGHIKCIVELDGGFHFKDNTYSGKTVEQQVKEDKLKQTHAEQEGFKVIHIDCNYGSSDRFLYIKENILNSELSELLDFSMVDFEACHVKAVSGFLDEIANSWNEGGKTVGDLSKEFGLSKSTMSRRLKDAYRCGLINESPSQINKICNKISTERAAKKTRKSIRCNETGEIFTSYSEADKKYGGNISKYLYDNRKHTGQLPDGTKLTWTKID